MRYERETMHAAFAEWARCRLYLDNKVFSWQGKNYFKMHLPPVFNETYGEVSEMRMISCFVEDLVEGGYRMIVLTPGPELPVF